MDDFNIQNINHLIHFHLLYNYKKLQIGLKTN